MNKPYLTEEEAAEYCGLDLETLRKHGPKLGVVAFPFVNVILFRTADLDCAMERAWRQSSKEAVPGFSNTMKTAFRNGPRLVKLPKPKPRHIGLQLKED